MIHLYQLFVVRARDTTTNMVAAVSIPPSLTLLSMVRADHNDTPIREGPMFTSPLYPASAMWRHALRRSQLQTKRQGVSTALETGYDTCAPRKGTRRKLKTGADIQLSSGWNSVSKNVLFYYLPD